MPRQQQLIIQIDLTDLGEDEDEDPGVVSEILSRLSQVDEPWWKGRSNRATVKDAEGKTIGRWIVTEDPSLYLKDDAVGVYKREEEIG
jgi:hypothetical protein